MAQLGKYSYRGPPLKGEIYPAQKSGDDSAFNTPKARPSPPKTGKTVNPKVPNSKIGVY